MRITEILVESELQEGPLLNKIGAGIGKVAGGAAKAVGAVAGGIAGIGGAIKKGFQAGKSTVASGGDTEPAAAGGTKPAGGGAGASAAAIPAQAQANPGTKVAPAAKPGAAGAPGAPGAPGAAAPAAKPGAPGAAAKPGANPKADSAYSAAQKAVSGLAPDQKKELITMLQADPKVKAAAAKPAAKPGATPGASPAAGGTGSGFNPHTGKPFASAAEKAAFDASPEANMSTADVEKAAAGGAAAPSAGAGAFGAMAGQLAKGGAEQPNNMANAPVSKTNTAKPGNPNAAPAAAPADAAGGKLTPQQVAAKTAELKGKRAAGKTTGTAASGFKQYTKDASSQRIVGANRDGSPKIQQIKASKINSGNIVAEGFTFYRIK